MPLVERQLKKHWAWVQPPEQRGIGMTPSIELSGILAVLQSRPELRVSSWADVKRLDVRPDRGMVKAWLQTDWEAQIDLSTGEILQVGYRRSDWIESIHDGSIFGSFVKLGLFLPTAVTLLLLWLGGMWMWSFPLMHKRRVLRARAQRARGVM